MLHPHDVPWDRPFLIHLRITGVLSGEPVYYMFPHEVGMKHLPFGVLEGLNRSGLVSGFNDKNLEGYSELPPILHETLIYRQPARYANSTIAQRLRRHAKESHIHRYEDLIKSSTNKRAIACYKQALDSFEMFDPLFNNGVYIGPADFLNEKVL